MAVWQKYYFSSKILVYCIILLAVGEQAQGIKLGLFAGDNKKLSSPIIIKRISRLSPVFININPPKLGKSALSLPKLPPKPPPLRLPEPQLPKLKKIGRKVPRSLLVPPMIPKLPILPIFPPLLPPLLPPLPSIPPILPPLPIIPTILPRPLLPRMLPLPRLPKPIKVPILGKTPLQKALGSELKPTISSLSASAKVEINKRVLDKLLDLKRKGSLSTAEYLRFRKLLLKK